MRVVFTRVRDDTHRFRIERADGSREEAELPSRSFLFHDLLHFATERAAGLQRGFYGLLAAGTPLDELNAYSQQVMAQPVRPDTEIAAVEMVVGALTGALKGGVDGAGFLAALDNLFGAHGVAVPAWCDAALLDAVRAAMRQLEGQYRSLPIGGDMELSFPDR